MESIKKSFSSASIKAITYSTDTYSAFVKFPSMMFLVDDRLNEGTTQSVGFEIFTAVIKKNAVNWDVEMCDSYKNRVFGGTHRLHHQGDKNRRIRNKLSSN
jgi:hypothetical protein